MTTIIEIPVLHTVHGTLRGRRKSSAVRVVETMPVEIEPLADAGYRAEIGDSWFRVSSGRPWFPIRGHARLAMTPAETTEASRAYAVALARTPSGPNDIEGVSALVGRTWRDLRHEVHSVSIPAGADWRVAFSSIETTDRDIAMETTRRVAHRLRTIEGRLHTDRFEPVVRLDEKVREERLSVAFDVVLNIVRRMAGVSTRATRPGGPVSEPIRPDHPGGLHVWPWDGRLRWILPMDASWAGDVEWETDRASLVAIGLGRNLDALVGGSDAATIRLRSAIGHRAVAALTLVSQWVLDREDGRGEPFTVEELSTVLDTVRRGVASADRYVAPQGLAVLERTLETTEVHLARLMEGASPAPAPGLDAGDAAALRLVP